MKSEKTDNSHVNMEWDEKDRYDWMDGCSTVGLDWFGNCHEMDADFLSIA